jgi:hypothetical protein
MPFANFSELKAQIVDWAAGAANIETKAADFIALFETRFNRDMTLAQMQKSASITPGTTLGDFDIPTDLASIISVSVSVGGESYPLVPITQAYAAAVRPATGVSPMYFYIAGTKGYVVPIGPGGVTVNYYAKLTPLSVSNPTNWLLTEAPDVYLYGSLLQTIPYTQDEGLAAVWGAAYQAALESLGAADHDRWSRAQMRPIGVSP